MSTADGSGNAYDATAQITESDDLRRKLAEIEEQISSEERQRQADRDELMRQLHEQERQVEGSTAHAAHVAQLERLYREALAAVRGAETAKERAQQHLDGAVQAHDEATAACDSAEQALAEVAGPEAVERVIDAERGRGDGLV